MARRQHPRRWYSLTSERAAAPGVNTEGDRKITEQEIENQNTRKVKLSDRDYASALDCVMACGTRWCPFECPKLGGGS